MSIDKARQRLNDQSATKKDLQESIDALRREAQYVRYAISEKYRSKEAGEEVLAEIQDLTEKLTARL